MTDADRTLGDKIRAGVPHSARIWNYWLGGKDNYAVDREVGDEFLGIYPGQADIARYSRAFLGRAVRYLVRECGIRQFLDVGTGLPTADNTHEVAQRFAPESRVVYVDNDPLVLVHARALLTSTPEGACSYTDADVRDTDKILTEAARTLDFTKPIALLMLGILGHIPDGERPGKVARRLIAALAPSSYAVINDGTDIMEHPETAQETGEEDELAQSARARAIARYIEAGGTPYHLRKPEQLAAFLEGAGMVFVEPGLVPTSRWRPEASEFGTPPMVDNYCGVARKA